MTSNLQGRISCTASGPRFLSTLTFRRPCACVQKRVWHGYTSLSWRFRDSSSSDLSTFSRPVPRRSSLSLHAPQPLSTTPPSRTFSLGGRTRISLLESLVGPSLSRHLSLQTRQPPAKLTTDVHFRNPLSCGIRRPAHATRIELLGICNGHPAREDPELPL